MQHDSIINCPKSGGDLCYKIEVNKDTTNYYSLSCGFWTNSLMTSGSDFYNSGTIVNTAGAANHATDGDISITTVSASGYVVIEVVKDSFNYS